MRIIAISDTHGNVERAREFLSTLGDFDLLVHLGDGTADLQRIKKFINADILAVSGNNDYDSALSTTRVIELGDTSVLCCHGHTYGVKMSLTRLAAAAKEKCCQIALYGHTHIKSDKNVDGIRLVNPGTIGFSISNVGAIEIVFDGEKTEIRIL